MKKQITVALIAISIIALSFKFAVDKTSATVEQIDGIQIFLFSKPTSKFDISGIVKEALITADNPEKRIKNLVGRAKDKFPSAEGIIISNDLHNAEVIRFKE